MGFFSKISKKVSNGFHHVVNNVKKTIHKAENGFHHAVNKHKSGIKKTGHILDRAGEIIQPLAAAASMAKGTPLAPIGKIGLKAGKYLEKGGEFMEHLADEEKRRHGLHMAKQILKEKGEQRFGKKISEAQSKWRSGEKRLRKKLGGYYNTANNLGSAATAMQRGVQQGTIPSLSSYSKRSLGRFYRSSKHGSAAHNLLSSAHNMIKSTRGDSHSYIGSLKSDAHSYIGNMRRGGEHSFIKNTLH